MSNVYNPSNQRTTGPGFGPFAPEGSAATYLTVTPAPPLDRSIPSRLRAAYDEAPKLPDRDLISLAHRTLFERAERAHQASQDVYAATHGGTTLFTDERPAFDAVMAGGVTGEDLDDAQHMQRLKSAERKVAAAEAAKKRETDRQAKRCRVPGCGKLDVPTRKPIVQLTIPNGPLDIGRTVVLDGAGVVCPECEAVIVAEYMANLAAAKLTRRTTRATAARDYLANTTPAKR